VTKDASGNDIGEQGHFPFGEPWYTKNSANGQWVFTTYQRDQESGLDYALARYYDSTVARFCSADPLGGQPGDPQSWNRYSHSRNDPVNLVDPSGMGFLRWLADIALVPLDIFSGGAATPEVAALGKIAEALTAAEAFARAAETVAKETESRKPKQPQMPKGYTACPPIWFTITGIGPKEAQGPGAAQVTPQVGDVAYNPSNFGLSNADAKALDRSDQPLQFQPKWDQARITNPGGKGSVAPVPGKGPQAVPDGLPVSQDQVLTGRDTIDIGARAGGQDRLDLYRYGDQKNADKSTRTAPVITLIPPGSKAKCPT